VVSLRIDPGNERGRWVMIDWVELSSEKAETAVAPEPPLRCAGCTVDCPGSVRAGEQFVVSAQWRIADAAGRTEATAFARLHAAEAVAVLQEKRVAIKPDKTAMVTFRLRAPAGITATLGLTVGIYEAAGAADSSEVHKEVRVVGERSVQGFPRCEIRQLGGSPAVFVNGKPLPFMCFCGVDSDLLADSPAASYHAEMARHGIRIFSDWFGRSYDGFLGREESGRYDYAAFDLYFARRLEEAPDAYFLPHVYVTPPKWWQKLHSDEQCRLDDGSLAPVSFASELWRREMADDLRRLIAHWQSQPYSSRIIGVIICSGYTAEWQTWGVWDDKFADYSDPAVRAWRKWLQTRYGTDSRLREAWGDPDVSIATAQPPSPQERRSSALSRLRDPKTDARVIDYLTFLNDLTADAIIHFARVAKEASGGRLLVGTYYGYLTQHHYHQAESGHLGIEKVLTAPEIDFLMSPPLYTDRAIGGVSGFMSVTDSVHGHGKIWLSEADYRTHLSDPGAGYGRASTEEESVNILWREFANVLCKRTGVSWFDMAGGWLSGPVIPAELGKMQKIMAEYMAQRRPWHAEVAVFVDPKSFCYLRPEPDLVAHITLYPVVNLLRSGAPFDLYVLSDLWTLDLRDYKLYVFLNAYALSDAERGHILQYVRRPGVSSLWHWAAGYAWPDQRRLATVQEMSDLVGLTLEKVADEAAIRLSSQDCAGEYLKRLDSLEAAQNPAIRLGPVWAPVGGERLAALAPFGTAALARADVGGAKVFYSALPQLPPAIIRQIYLDSGVHLYVDSDDCFYGDDAWVGIHTTAARKLTVSLPRTSAARSVRRPFETVGAAVTLDLPAHFTELLHYR
ncbi:MAG: beta-galactosidase, partial [Armatimonadetes bacterium]|nr:beta-galactosidase [Armatimonadota bacterium]